MSEWARANFNRKRISSASEFHARGKDGERVYARFMKENPIGKRIRRGDECEQSSEYIDFENKMFD